MGILKFVFEILSILKNPKAAGGAIGVLSIFSASGAVVLNEVNLKHSIAMQEIRDEKETTERLARESKKILIAQAQMLEALRHIGSNVEKTSQKIDQIEKDTNSIKTDVEVLKFKVRIRNKGR